MLSMAQCHKHQLRLLLHNDYKLKKRIIIIIYYWRSWYSVATAVDIHPVNLGSVPALTYISSLAMSIKASGQNCSQAPESSHYDLICVRRCSTGWHNVHVIKNHKKCPLYHEYVSKFTTTYHWHAYGSPAFELAFKYYGLTYLPVM